MVLISPLEITAEVVIVATNAMDKAPRTPPSMAMLRHTADILSPNLLKKASIGYTVAALAIVTAAYATTMSKTDCERVITFVSKPMIRNAIELPRKAAICQNVVTASFDAGSMADRIVKLPKYNPATATAISPE